MIKKTTLNIERGNDMMSKKSRRINWPIGCFSLLALCFSLFLIPSSEAKGILFGINHDITGVMAPVGRTERDSCLMAIDEWNAKGGIKGQKIETVFMNNGGDPVRATSNARNLKDKGVAVVHGGSYSTAAIAEIKVLAPAQIPMLGCGCSTAIYQQAKGPDGKTYYFAAFGADPDLARGYLDVAAKAGLKKVAFLYLNVAWPRDIVEIMKEWIRIEYGPKYGMNVVGAVEADVKATDFAIQVHELKNFNADGIIAFIYTGHALGLARAFTDAEWYPKWVTGWSQVDDVWEKSSSREIFYNLYSPSYWSYQKPEAVAKREEFVKKYNYQPTGHFAPAYDITNLALSAINEVGANGPAIRDWMATKAYGRPLISGTEGMTCHFKEEEETWLGKTAMYFSLFDGTDYAPVYVNKKGELDWMKLK